MTNSAVQWPVWMGPPKWRAWRQLVRAPNLVTAVADVLAGFIFAGGTIGEWSVFARLAGASVCLYAAGVILNDVCDAELDAVERPARPIPSGQITRDRALGVMSVLAAIALVVTWWVSWQALLVASAILVCIILYNVLKPTHLAAPMMGMCRSLNLLLGMHELESLVPLPAWRPMGVMGLYVACVTIFARREATGGSRIRLALGVAGTLSALYGLWQLRWYGENARYAEYRWLVLAMAAGIIALGGAALASPSPKRIQRAVMGFIMGIVLIDACIAWSSGGPMAGALVAILIMPFLALARTSRVT